MTKFFRTKEYRKNLSNAMKIAMIGNKNGKGNKGKIRTKEMIEALSKLPMDAELIITEEGYYSYTAYTEAFLPEKYKDGESYVIGHSIQHW